MQRCPRVENPGEGVPEVFAKIPRGVKFSWGAPNFRFYCIFINKCFEICLGWGVLYLLVPSPPPCV